MTRSRRGGKAIAAGSDGCVFDGTFAKDGTFTPGTDIVTKVFIDKKVVDQERAMMELVNTATGGSGVVVSTTPIVTITSKIPAEAWDNEEIKSRGACKKVNEGKPPFYGLVTPRIDGTLLDLYNDKGATHIRSYSFDLLDTALTDMKREGLIHMDLAARNIFYKGNDFLLGDFGNTIVIKGVPKDDGSIDNGPFDQSIIDYTTGYNMSGDFSVCLKMDGVHPVSMALVICYDALIRGKDDFEAFQANTRLGGYKENTVGVSKATWAYKRLKSKIKQDDAGANASLEEFRKSLEKQFVIILNVFTDDTKKYEGVITEVVKFRNMVKTHLAYSDKRLLELVKKFSTTEEYLSKKDIDDIRTAWFPGSVVQTTGGNKTETEDLSYDSVQSALASELILEKDGVSVTITDDDIKAFMNQTAGKRKTRRNRVNRVKISRRHK